MHGKRKRKLRYKYKDKTSYSIPRLSYLSTYSYRHSALYGIPVACGSALLLLGLAWINPVANVLGGFGSDVSDKAYAEEVTSTGTAISLLIDGLGENGDEVESIASSVNAMDSDTAYISHNVTVSASNIENYILQVTSADGSSNSLEHNVSNFTITPTSSTTLEDNTWGYGWSETGDDVSSISYYGLPVYGASDISIGRGLLEAGNADSNGNVDFTKKLTFGAKFSNVPAGHYTATALLSLAASPVEMVGVGFGGYTYMQDLDKSKCDAIPVGTEGRLIDKRDNKIYWVARLKNSVDDNALCWMTQNLDYDGGAIAGYSGSDVVTLEKNTTSFGNDNTTTHKYYYDPGNYVYALGAETNKCNGQSLTTGFRACINNGWSPVDASVLASQTLEPSVAKSLHYYIGNYYNWIAATNGTGSVTANYADASGSICSTGWGLPASGSAAPNSFGRLVNGLKNTDIAIAPYYFVYGGVVVNDTLDSIGNGGSYWSSTANASHDACNFGVSGNAINASVFNNRYIGESVRCVAK